MAGIIPGLDYWKRLAHDTGEYLTPPETVPHNPLVEQFAMNAAQPRATTSPLAAIAKGILGVITAQKYGEAKKTEDYRLKSRDIGEKLALHYLGPDYAATPEQSKELLGYLTDPAKRQTPSILGNISIRQKPVEVGKDASIYDPGTKTFLQSPHRSNDKENYLSVGGKGVYNLEDKKFIEAPWADENTPDKHAYKLGQIVQDEIGSKKRYRQVVAFDQNGLPVWGDETTSDLRDPSGGKTPDEINQENVKFYLLRHKAINDEVTQRWEQFASEGLSGWHAIPAEQRGVILQNQIHMIESLMDQKYTLPEAMQLSEIEIKKGFPELFGVKPEDRLTPTIQGLKPPASPTGIGPDVPDARSLIMQEINGGAPASTPAPAVPMSPQVTAPKAKVEVGTTGGLHKIVNGKKIPITYQEFRALTGTQGGKFQGHGATGIF